MTIKHLQPIPPLKVFFSIVLTLLAFTAAIQGSFFGFVLLGLALRFALQKGVEIDLGSKKYRNLYAIFAIPVGTWNDLPDIEYVSIFKTKKKTRTRGVSAETTIDSIVYKVNLFHGKNKHIEAYYSDSKDDSYSVAKNIAMALKVDVWDATEKDKKWL